MKFLLRFVAWATVAFCVAWVVHPPWQRVIGAIGARLASPRGTTIEVMDLELFYPFDLGVYAALCMASSWVPRGRRLRALALGTPLLVLVEILALVVAFRLLMVPTDPDAAERTADGIIRASGLLAASGAWLYLLGRERLSLTARQWLGS